MPRGSILTLVGDIDPAGRHRRRSAAAWAAGRSEHAARELSAPPPITPGDLDLVHRPGSVQSQLRLSAAAVPRRDPGYPALQLANLVFGGYFSSRWMENIREDKGYTYSAHSGVGDRSRAARCSASRPTWPATSPRPRCWRPATSWAGWPPCRRRRRRSTRPGAYAIGSLLISLDNQGGLASMLTALAADGLDVDWLRGHPARLEAVTADEVAAAALRFFAPSRVHRRAGRRRRA